MEMDANSAAPREPTVTPATDQSSRSERAVGNNTARSKRKREETPPGPSGILRMIPQDHHKKSKKSKNQKRKYKLSIDEQSNGDAGSKLKDNVRADKSAPNDESDEPMSTDESKEETRTDHVSSASTQSEGRSIQQQTDEDTVYWQTLACLRSKYCEDSEFLEDGELKSHIVQALQPTEETQLSERIPYKPEEAHEEVQNILSDVFSNQSLNAIKAKNIGTVLYKPSFVVPALLYTFGYKKGMLGKNAKEIVNEAAKFDGGINAENPVYNSETFSYAKTKFQPKDLPTNFFESRGFPVLQEENQMVGSSSVQYNEPFLPLPIVKLDIEDPDLEKKAMTVSVCVVENAGLRINADIFSNENLQKVCENEKITVLRQIGQHSSQNEQIGVQRSSVHVVSAHDKRKVVEMLEHVKKLATVSEQAYKKCITKGSIVKSDLLQLQRELKHTQLSLDTKELQDFEHIEELKNSPQLIISFGSNIDIDDEVDDHDAKQDVEKKQALVKALKGLPEWIRPRKKLMRLIRQKIRGVNRIQVYVKGPGCRTTAHFENEGIVSVNINLGPDDCVWFTVSMKHAPKLEKLMCDKNVLPCHDPIWLTEEHLREAKIPYSKFIQKAGEMVVIQVGTYHWVQSNGFCTNVSWNVLLETKSQLAVAALFNDYNAMHRYDNALPIESLLWNIAKEKKLPNSEFSELAKRLLTCSLAHATMEQKIAEEKGFSIKDGKQFSEILDGVYMCSRAKCHRKYLFSQIFLKATKQHPIPLCINCARNEKKESITCYRIHTLEELIADFDSYH